MSPQLSRALSALAIFVLVGPAIGAAIFAVLMTLLLAVADAGLGLAVVYLTLAFFPLAYLVGGLQAAFVGAATAVAIWRKGFAPLWVPLLAATAAGSLAASRAHESWDATAILLATHILSALVCWAMLPGAKPGAAHPLPGA